MQIPQPVSSLHRRLRTLALLLACPFALALTSCSSSSSGDGGPAPLLADISGSWAITTTITAAFGNCSVSAGLVETNTTEIEANREAGTILIDPGAEELPGTLNGVVATLQGTRQDPDGPVVFDVSLTFNQAGTSFSGRATFTEQTPQGECTISFDVVGTKTPGQPQATPPPVVENIDIDGQGDHAIVKLNVPFFAVADFALANDPSCPTCIQQLVVGFDGIGMDCLYNGIPELSGTFGTNAVALIGDRIGTFDVRWQNAFEFNCVDALGLFTTQASERLGSVTVVDEDSYSIIPSNIDIDGQGQIATVAPGQSVTVDLDYQLWSIPTCPGCILQIVIGVEDQPFECAYNGIPGAFPGTSGAGQVTVTAPTTPGTYAVRYLRGVEFTCADAINLYQQSPPSENAIGWIVVP